MKKVDLTFLFCNWYSGGTLFSIILNDSPDIVCNGEVFPCQDVDMNNDCSCGEVISKCQFYNFCASGMKNSDGSYDMDVFRVLPKLSNIEIINRYFNSFFPSPALKNILINMFPRWKIRLSSYIDSHISFVEKALEFDKKRVYVDGNKNIRRAELFSREKNINLKVIHLIRDGRGFCNSWVKNRGIDREEGLKTAAIDWNNYIAQVDEFSNRYPDIPVLIVKYEDLCTSLDLQHIRVQEFLGLSSSWKGWTGKPFHILGNRMRRSFTGKIKQDLTWQSELSPEQIAFVESIMKNQLERYGYI